MRRGLFDVVVQPPPEQQSTLPPAESQYVTAAENIRQAARWLVAAFAGVGGVLVAGVPLTDVGRVESGTSDFWWAVLGVLAALIAIAYMIYVVSRVFTAEFVSFAEWSEGTVPRRGRGEKRRHKQVMDIGVMAELSSDELFGAEATHLGELNERLRESNKRLRKESRGDGEPPPHVAARAANATAAANRVMEFVNYEYVRRTFRRLYPRLAIGAFVVAAGVGTYVFQTAQSPPRDQAVVRPTPVKLFLDSGTDERARLGDGCRVTEVPAVAVAGSLAEPEVVTQAAAGCNAARISVTDDVGVAVPLAQASGTQPSSP